MHIIYGVLLILLIESSYAGHILHISDIHLDLEYHEGASSECWFKFFGCCHPTTIPFKHYNPAGHFGSYNCSASLVLVESIFDWIRNNLNESTGKNIDFIVYTGDSVGNHLTLINPYSAFEYMGIVSRLFQSYFPGIPVVFTPGNHDSFPPDQWSILDSFNTHNWYKQIQFYIPESEKETFLKGGYYSYSPKKGLMILSINSFFGERHSFFTKDSALLPMIQWMEEKLEFSRSHHHSVYIVMHFGLCRGDMTDNMREHLRRLYTEYNDIIKCIFSGHTHREENIINYIYSNQPGPKYALGPMNLVTGSIRTETKDPSFRLYEYNELDFSIEDSFTYIVDLPQSNQQNSLVVREYPSYKTLFHLSSFSSASFDQFYYDMRKNMTIAKQFLIFYSNSIYRYNITPTYVDHFVSSRYC